MARLLYFAGLVDALGLASEEFVLPPGVSNVRELLGWLRQRGSAWQAALADEAVRVTVNKQFAAPEDPVADRDEIALVPRR
jgi:molybdopterin synthase sulfur carrier subunit